MDNALNYLIKNVIDFFLEFPKEEDLEDYRKFSTLIRIHNEKLTQFGDVSFPSKAEIWQKYFCKTNRQLNELAHKMLTNEKLASEEVKKFLDAAKQWPFPVERLELRQERMQLYLQRSSIVRILVPDVLGNVNYGHLEKVEKYVYLYDLPEVFNENDLSFYRSKLLCSVLQKLLKYSRWKQIYKVENNYDGKCYIKVNVQSMASKIMQNNQVVVIKCGLVIDPCKNGKLCNTTTKDYLNIRSNDMTLMALHKYGIRVKQSSSFCALMERLGYAAVTVDLLEVKHTSPVRIIRSGQGSTKGASFILYNSARLETILRTFQNRVDEGDFDPLPHFDKIDWNLLKEEEEWQLVYVYLAGFPHLIDRCLEQLENGVIATHLIIHFLHGFVATFSIYYRRIKILTEKRDHLMPYIYVRIYLIKALREILNKTLALLDIEPVEFM